MKIKNAFIAFIVVFLMLGTFSYHVQAESKTIGGPPLCLVSWECVADCVPSMYRSNEGYFVCQADIKIEDAFYAIKNDGNYDNGLIITGLGTSLVTINFNSIVPADEVTNIKVIYYQERIEVINYFIPMIYNTYNISVP
ncbi:MAG TPA: hypothetical protein DC057_03405 [Spirochaetia bacterium]|nr:hypothetical protein [Spirochaetia bacterium]